jgi:Undecaprenyl-phosphate glucose phosphotransferase
MTMRLKSAVKTMFTEPPSLAARNATLSPDLPYRFPFRLIGPAVVAGDFFIILLASVLSGIGYHWIFLSYVGNIESFFAIGILTFAYIAAFLSAQRNYRATNLISFTKQLRYVTLNWWFICFALTGVAFTLKIGGDFSRAATLTFFVVGWGGLIGFRAVVARTLAQALEAGAFAETKIIVITEAGQQNNSRALSDLRDCGYLPLKTYELTPTEIDAVGVAPSLQSKLENVISICQRENIDHLFLLINWNRRHFIDDLVRMLRILPISVHLLPDSNVSDFLVRGTVSVGTALTVELQRAPLTVVEQAFKRAFDFVGAIVAIILLSPLMLISALIIKFDSSGPVLFTQKRNGFNGSTFFIYKFRTMNVLEDGNVIRQAALNDPRVTRIGSWLRKTSIDELPQLFNVVIGEMSLVGPRPHAIAHNNEYQKIVANYAFRHHMKPGITGWAQVNGFRGETQTTLKMAQRVDSDLWYINHWSPWLDLRILLKTLVLAYRQPTAY